MFIVSDYLLPVDGFWSSVYAFLFPNYGFLFPLSVSGSWFLGLLAVGSGLTSDFWLLVSDAWPLFYCLSIIDYRFPILGDSSSEAPPCVMQKIHFLLKDVTTSTLVGNATHFTGNPIS